MKLLGPVAFVLAMLVLLAVTGGFGIRRARDGKDLSWSDGLVLFGMYVAIVFWICFTIDFVVAVVALVKAWRT